MNRAFLSNIILLLVVNLLVKPFYIFGIEIPMQNTVGNAAYGTFFTFTGFTMLFQIINEAGFHQFSSRTIAQDRTLFPLLFRKITVLKIGMGVIFMLLIAAGGWIMGYWKLSATLLLLVGFNQILVGYIPYLRSNLSSLGRYAQEGLVSVLDKVVMIFVIGYFLAFERASFTIFHFVIGQTIGFSVTILVIVWMLRRELRQYVTIKEQTYSWKQILRSSLPFGLIIFLSMVYSRIDAVMIEAMMDEGAEQAGIYGAAFRLMDAAIMFAFLFAGLLLPMFSRMISQNKPPVELYKLAFNIVTVLALVVAVPVFFNRHEIMKMLYTAYTTDHGQLLGILFIAFVARATTFVSGTFIMANNQLSAFNLLLGITVLVNVILNFWWIKVYGTIGAAWATCLTQCFVALGCIYIIQRSKALSKQGKLLVKLGLFALVVIGLTYAIDAYVPLQNWIVGMVLEVVVIMIAALSSGLISYSSITELLRSRSVFSEE